MNTDRSIYWYISNMPKTRVHPKQLRTKTRLTQLNLLGICAPKKCKRGGNKRQRCYIPYLPTSLHGVVNSRANVVFAIIALDLTFSDVISQLTDLVLQCQANFCN